MKQMGTNVLVFVVFVGLVGCTSMSNQLTGADVKPGSFCRVLNEPDPMLMGNWKVNYESTLDAGGSGSNIAEYRLIKYEDKYALYFYRMSPERKKSYVGWREWTIDGTEITSDTGVKIFTRDGQVFLEWQGEKPTKMYRTQVVR
jgi:hypothetical protein